MKIPKKFTKKLKAQLKFELMRFFRNKMFPTDQTVASRQRYLHLERIARKRPHFKVGDRVKFHKGGVGTVISGDSLICSVEWDDYKLRGNPFNSDDPSKGRNISISLPAIDKGWYYNPIIKRYGDYIKFNNE